MTFRFKGVSEYRNKFKGQGTRSRSASPQLRMRQAGLRSDQLGISREPQFLSKKRAPLFTSEFPGSLQQERSVEGPKIPETPRPTGPPAEPAAERRRDPEGLKTPLAPRGPRPPGLQAAEPLQGTSPQPLHPGPEGHPLVPVDKTEPVLNGVNHVLRKRAGLSSAARRSGLQSSEYQRQFMWKEPTVSSPLLAAEQMVHSHNAMIPPFKTDPVVLESEYRRSFKGSPPHRGPRLRRDVEDREGALLQLGNVPPETSSMSKRRKTPKPRRSSGENRPPGDICSQKPLRPHSPRVGRRKVKSEYVHNFRSPLQYRYKDGGWVKSTTAGDEGCDSDRSHMWYYEVIELREKAKAYRRRAWGTHFSRDHLNQILSDQNRLWEASTSSSMNTEDSSSRVLQALDLARAESDRGSHGTRASVTPSPTTSRRGSVVNDEKAGLHDATTLPVQRRLAWEDGEEPGLGVGSERDHHQEEQHLEQRPEENRKTNYEKGGLGGSHLSPVSGSESSSEEGRLPTPKLKTQTAPQRTHHDLTTPATGGAILVSPPKLKDSPRGIQRGEPPLGKTCSPLKHLSQAPPQTEQSGLPRASPAAGLTTVDPIPLRDEDSPNPERSPGDPSGLRHARSSRKRADVALSPAAAVPVAAPANRIQGTLRDPEFQHNGNLGLKRPEPCFPPSNAYPAAEHDDRMSQISSRSAASCSTASQVLTRAQKRRDFWGKT